MSSLECPLPQKPLFHKDSEVQLISDDVLLNLPNPKTLAKYFEEYCACNEYSERLHFFEKYELHNTLTLHCRKGFKQYYIIGKGIYQLENMTWNAIKQNRLITLAPTTRRESEEFINWALATRSSMQLAPYSSDAYQYAFLSQYEKIRSKSDKEEFWLTTLKYTRQWKKLGNEDEFNNDEENTLYFALNTGKKYIRVHFDLFKAFINQLILSKQIKLSDYYKPEQIFISWSIIDTYLFAKAIHEFTLFLEEFTPEHYNIAKSDRSNVVLTIPQLALLFNLNNDCITSNNASSFLAYWTNRTTVQRLLDFYEDYKSVNTRTQPSRGKLNDFRTILPLVKPHLREQAQREYEECLKRSKIHKTP